MMIAALNDLTFQFYVWKGNLMYHDSPRWMDNTFIDWSIDGPSSPTIFYKGQERITVSVGDVFIRNKQGKIDIVRGLDFEQLFTQLNPYVCALKGDIVRWVYEDVDIYTHYPVGIIIYTENNERARYITVGEFDKYYTTYYSMYKGGY